MAAEHVDAVREAKWRKMPKIESAVGAPRAPSLYSFLVLGSAARVPHSPSRQIAFSGSSQADRVHAQHPFSPRKIQNQTLPTHLLANTRAASPHHKEHNEHHQHNAICFRAPILGVNTFLLLQNNSAWPSWKRERERRKGSCTREMETNAERYKQEAGRIVRSDGIFFVRRDCCR